MIKARTNRVERPTVDVNKKRKEKSQQEASVECPLPYASSQNGVSHARPLIRPDKPGLYGPSRFTPALLAACTPSPAGTTG